MIVDKRRAYINVKQLFVILRLHILFTAYEIKRL